MRTWSLRIIAALVLHGILIEWASGAQFVVFDGTLYLDKPDLAKQGLQPINILYAGSFWGRSQVSQSLPTQTRINRMARESYVTGLPTVIDIEYWEVQEPQANGHSTENISKYLTVLQWFHRRQPKLQLGYYGNVPIRDYWRAIEGSSSAN
jgi:hypothetical protein